MRITPTALGCKGVLFFAVVVVLFLATPYSNLFFLMTAFLAVLGCIGVLASIRNMRRVTGSVRAIAMAPKDTGHDVVARLTAPGAARYGITAELLIEGRRPMQFAETTLLQNDGAARGRADGLPRGVHRVTTLRLSSRHPFGIVRSSLHIPVTDVEITSYPEPLQLTHRQALGAISGDGDQAPPNAAKTRSAGCGSGDKAIHCATSTGRPARAAANPSSRSATRTTGLDSRSSLIAVPNERSSNTRCR